MEVKKKPNESVASLMRRFSRLAQQTKLVQTAKLKRNRKKKLTPRVEKNRAIMRVELQALRRHLERIGKHDDETFEEEKRKIKQKLDL
jgi:hypothetical protein